MSNEFTTSDIALAAYLLMKNLSLISCKIESSGKYFFLFEDSNQQAAKLSIDFLNSECSRFDNQMRNLRKILNSQKY